MAKKYFITFGLILQKASFDPKILKKNQPCHVFFKMTGSAIFGLAVTMSAADTRFTSIANIARENHYVALTGDKVTCRKTSSFYVLSSYFAQCAPM